MQHSNRCHHAWLFVALFIVLTQSIYASNITSHDLHALKTTIDSLLTDYSIPGVGIALVDQDSILWVEGLGFSDWDEQKPVTENTLFRVASITKSFVALGFLKLVDEGKIDLDTPVRDIAPEIPIDNPWAQTDPVRIVHLLEHTSGFDYQHFKESYNFSDNPEPPLAEVLAISPQTRNVKWKPGTRMAYSNHAYTLAAYILEKVTGKKFEDYLAQEIMQPIGMNGTSFCVTETNQALISKGYLYHFQSFPFQHLYMRPAGCALASAKDMAIWVQFMLNRGRIGDSVFIQESLIDRMETPTTSTLAKAGFNHFGHGLGLRIRERNGRKFYGHTGGIPEFTGLYAYFKDIRKGCVILSNRANNGGMWAIFDAISDYLYKDTILPNPKSFHLKAEQQKKYVGYYGLRNTDSKMDLLINYLTAGISISFANDTLYQQGFMEEKVPLIPMSDNTFRRPWEANATLIFTREDGNMILGDPLYKSEYQRSAAWKPALIRILLMASIAILVLQLLYAFFWIPIRLFKKIRKISNPNNLLIKLVPLFAFLGLLIGIFGLQSVMSYQESIYIGQKSFGTVTFCIGTLLFAFFSFANVLVSANSFRQKKRLFDKLYSCLLSFACLTVTSYLMYWGIIGLRTWAY